jgi:hypothetical protein
MVKEITIYTCCCDRCGVSADEDGCNMGWVHPGFAVSGPIERKNWKEIDHSHYCPNCYESNDNGEFVVKPKP